MIVTFLGRAFGDLQRDFACEIADGALKLPHAGFAGVARRQQVDRVVGDLELLGRQAVLLDLPRDQILLGDIAASRGRCNPAELNDLHAVAQRRRDRPELIGGRDKEDLRKIERQIEIVVAKRVVLRRIEYLEQRRRRIAAKIVARACRSRRASSPDCSRRRAAAPE